MTQLRTTGLDSAGVATVGAVSRGHAVLQLVARRLSFVLPVLALVALAVFLLGAASPFDPIFQYYGVGIFTASATVTAALDVDFPLLAAVTLLTTAVVLLGALLADVAIVLLDPRVRADG